MSQTPDKSIDCKGMSCPEPVLRTKMAINELDSGQYLEMISTDAGSANDIPAWSKRTGNPIIESSEADGVWRFLIQKS